MELTARQWATIDASVDIGGPRPCARSGRSARAGQDWIEVQQVGIDRRGLGRGHAVRKTGVGL